jgi:hypothetical protein
LGVLTSAPAIAPEWRTPLAVLVAAPAAVALVRLLPEHGAGLALRLAVAAFCVLLLPGGALLRAFAWPADLSLAITGSFLASLGVIFVALALTLLVNASLSFTVGVLALVAAAGLVLSARTRIPRSDGSDRLPVIGLTAVGLALGAVTWWSHRVISGDAIYHLARVRRLDELPSLDKLSDLDYFTPGAVHPGYAFPLWHAAVALVARIGGVDDANAILRLAPLLVPLVLIVAYAAGKALFRSWAGGVAVAAALVAQLGFARGGTGVFSLLTLPSTGARLLMATAVLAIAFAFVEDGRWAELALVAVGGLALVATHPTYAFFVGVPLGGFLLARLLLVRDDHTVARRIAAAVAALAAPTGLFYIWLLPAVQGTAAFTPSGSLRRNEITHYSGYVRGSGWTLRLAPGIASRGGAPIVAALAAVPLAGLAARRRWAAFVLGGTIAVLAVALVPFFFKPLSDLFSLSQSRRLVQFLPLPFASAGLALFLGRLRLAGAALAAALGVAFELLYSAEVSYRVDRVGPVWAPVLALVGGIVALVLGAIWARRGPDLTRWTAVAAIAFVVPVAVSGLRDLQRDPADPGALTPGLVQAVRADVPTGSIVFADLDVGYRLPAYAPVYVAAAPPVHVGFLEGNHSVQRRADVLRFFERDTTDVERRRLLRRYGADWLVIDRKRWYPPALVASLTRVYADSHYALYRVGEA